MCGFAVLINLKNQPIERAQIERTTRAVAHRGPDGEQFVFAENVAFGYRFNRLFAARKQQFFVSKDVNVVLDGEIFNRAAFAEAFDLASDLSDAEMIARAFAAVGMGFLEKLDGKFAFIIHDRLAAKLYAVRDRFGFKPLYFSKIGDQFAFVSEIKQFTFLNHWQARLNLARARDFLAFGRQDHTDETLFDGVQQVQLSQFLCFNLKKQTFHVENYYDLRQQVQAATPQYISKKTAFQQGKTVIRQTIFDSIARHLTDGGAFGTTLSGGLDSTIVTAVAKNLMQHKPFDDCTLSAFSLTLKEKTPLDETHFIELAARHADVSVQKVTPQYAAFREQLSDFVWAQDEPVYTDSAFASFLVYRAASDAGVRRVFGGVGADAALAGYTKYMLLYVRALRQQERPLSMLRELAGFAWHGGWRQVFYLLKKRKMTENAFENWLNPAFADPKTLQPPFAEATTMDDFTMEHFLTDATVALHFDDRNAAAAAVESYFPMYDRAFVERCVAFPDDFKIRNGKQKFILREAFRDLLPSDIYNRHDKMGFYNPGEFWMQADADWFVAQFKQIVEKNGAIFTPNLLVLFEDFARHNRLRVSETVFWRVFFFGKWLERFEVTIL